MVDAAGFERFALFGASQSGAIAITYAARHPERVTRLVIYGGFLRGAMRRNPTPDQVADDARARRARLGAGRVPVDVIFADTLPPAVRSVMLKDARRASLL
ncbi:MAG TPA: alpha/beta fold hydrolase [Burkholderiales bacterium]|nr:alpha/beta fold hydrolase [Burkholderiales bacterium]